MDIENRVVVITGATGGLGQVVTRQFAEHGARLVLAGTRADKLEGLAEELRLQAECTLTVASDLSEPGAADALVQKTIEKFDRLDILLHLVGGWIGGRKVVDMEREEVESMLRQHLWTTYGLSKAVLPVMTANRWGRIVVVSSPTATRPAAQAGPYAIGKAAQEALVLTIAQEVRAQGVTANILQVKTIDTEHLRARKPDAQNSTWTAPEDIAAALLFLSSNEAGMINGARIPLYGGRDA